jgi:hypothetical protein
MFPFFLTKSASVRRHASLSILQHASFFVKGGVVWLLLEIAGIVAVPIRKHLGSSLSLLIIIIIVTILL